MRAHVWRWDEVRPRMVEAGSVISAEEAERRVLVLENPAYPGQSRATSTLYAGVQMVLPREIAPAHRHTQSALRFTLESTDGYTTVGGERVTMAPGDLVLTPPWSFHDHGNDGPAPAIWMDVLDVPIVAFCEAGFAQPHNSQTQMPSRREGDGMARYGSNLLPMDRASPYGLSSPLVHYPYSRTRKALQAVADGGLDPYWGATLRFANPLDGAWPMPTIACWMTFLPAGFAGRPIRSTDGLIIAVAEGRGTALADDSRILFGPKDVVAIPNWTWRSFVAHEDTFLFCCSDRALQEKIGLWREERAS
jgi:gentisate 1,2-dioxygenase